MSRLEELIAELCPEGVEVVELGQVAHYAKNRIDADAVTEIHMWVLRIYCRIRRVKSLLLVYRLRER